jgi:hypothetical protein
MLLKKEFGENRTMGSLPPTPRILVTGPEQNQQDKYF